MKDMHPVELYQSILRYIEKGRYETAAKAIALTYDYFEKIERETDTGLVARMQRAVEAEDESAALAAFGDVVTADVARHLKTSSDYTFQDPGKAKAALRTAYALYLVVSPAMKESDFDRDRRTKRAFQRAYGALGGNSPYSEESRPIEERAKLAAEIIDHIQALVNPVSGLKDASGESSGGLAGGIIARQNTAGELSSILRIAWGDLI